MHSTAAPPFIMTYRLSVHSSISSEFALDILEKLKSISYAIEYVLHSLQSLTVLLSYLKDLGTCLSMAQTHHNGTSYQNACLTLDYLLNRTHSSDITIITDKNMTFDNNLKVCVKYHEHITQYPFVMT